jgi:hypothetical protein
MTRIDHTGHDHPATPAARKACRDAMRNTPTVANAARVSGRTARKLGRDTAVARQRRIDRMKREIAEYQAAIARLNDGSWRTYNPYNEG